MQRNTLGCLDLNLPGERVNTAPAHGELDISLVGIHYLEPQQRKRIWEEWLSYDNKLSLARIVRRTQVEKALEVDSDMLREFHDVFQTLDTRDVALTLDFSFEKKTYMDRPVPTLASQSKAVPSTSAQLAILCFNCDVCHPGILVELADTLLRDPQLFSRIESASFEIPRDMI